MIRLFVILLLIAHFAKGQVPVVELPQSIQFVIPKVGQPDRGPSGNYQNTHLSTIIPVTNQIGQHNQIKNEVDNFVKQHSYRDQLISEAHAELERNQIVYEFELGSQEGVDHYQNAYIELKKMIDGQSPGNLKRAVFLVEHAYDNTLEYKEFDRQIKEATLVIGEKMKQDRLNPADNTAKVMSIFQYMSDTITAYIPSIEKKLTSYPKTYDFEDFWGKQDYRKMFVSKVMRTGRGQCHSLPLFFLILAEEIGAEANLAFSPNHSFVKFKDRKGKWHNLELTNGMLASDHFMIQSGFIKAEALQSKIFLDPLSKNRTIVQCLNDLALGYIKKYGYDRFVKASTNLVLSHDPNSITAHQINANYFTALANFINYQYEKKGLKRNALEQDQRAMSVINSAKGAVKHIEQLGYSDMPEEAYELWLKSIKDQAGKQQHMKEIQGLNGMIERR